MEDYNNVRLNNAIGYITPKDMLACVSRRSMLSGIGSWRRRETAADSSPAGCVKNAPAQSPGQPKHRMKWIAFGGWTRWSPLADALDHSTITPLTATCLPH